MKSMFRSFFAALAIALLLSLAGVAQNDTTNNSTNRDMHKSDTSGAPLTQKESNATETSKSGSLSAADKNFVKKAAEANMAEVELGNLAKEKASSPEVKQFGERMVTDHTKANEELKTVASEKGVTLPTDLDAKDKATKQRLEKLSGEQFDRAYMNDMVKDHTKDVSEFKKESAAAKDPAVKSYASQTLPTLEDHLKEARQIAPKTSKETASNKKSSGQ